MRLKGKIEDRSLEGAYKFYPIVDANDVPLWPGKFKTPESIDHQRLKVIDERAWFREYMLRIVSSQGQIIQPDWIHFYDALPPQDEGHEFLNTFLGVDLAISEKQTADCTAVVVIHAYGYEAKNRKYYFSPHHINERLSFLKSQKRIEEFALAMSTNKKPLILVEDNSYQHAMVEVLQDNDLEVKGLKSITNKHARLETASMLFEQSKVFFPSGDSCKPIITQLLGFGIEKHDDLCDASTLALNYISMRVRRTILMAVLGGNRHDNVVYTMDYGD